MRFNNPIGLASGVLVEFSPEQMMTAAAAGFTSPLNEAILSRKPIEKYDAYDL